MAALKHGQAGRFFSCSDIGVRLVIFLNVPKNKSDFYPKELSGFVYSSWKTLTRPAPATSEGTIKQNKAIIQLLAATYFSLAERNVLRWHQQGHSVLSSTDHSHCEKKNTWQCYLHLYFRILDLWGSLWRSTEISLAHWLVTCCLEQEIVLYWSYSRVLSHW